MSDTRLATRLNLRGCKEYELNGVTFPRSQPVMMSHWAGIRYDCSEATREANTVVER